MTFISNEFLDDCECVSFLLSF